MQMNHNLGILPALKALKTALIETSVDYDWWQLSRDNVGLLAQCITRTDKDSLYEEYLSDIVDSLSKRKKMKRSPNWTQLVAEYWPITGAPTCEIFLALSQAGVKRSDIFDLEYLTGKYSMLAEIKNTTRTVKTSKKITKKVGFWIFKREVQKIIEEDVEIRFYQEVENLKKYINAWINELEENKEKAGGVIIVDGEKFPYRNSFQLSKLKDHFLSLENYVGVKIAQEELDKYKK